jgi:RimJ/RimL family protein N-acetyltransferase
MRVILDTDVPSFKDNQSSIIRRAMMKAPAEIQTPRLVLSRPEAADAESIFQRYASDPEVTRLLSWRRHQSIAETEGFLRFSAQSWEDWPAGPYLIRSRDSGQLLGGTGLAFAGANDAVTGYVLAKDAWGKGYATEALTAVVQIAPQIGVKRLIAQCHPDHQKSRRVLEKCGFVRDLNWTQQTEFPNLAPGVPQDVLCYERLFEPNPRTRTPEPLNPNP